MLRKQVEREVAVMHPGVEAGWGRKYNHGMDAHPRKARVDGLLRLESSELEIVKTLRELKES